MTPRVYRGLMVPAVMAVAALSQVAIIVPIGAMDYVGLWFFSAVAVVLFGFLPVARNGAQIIPWAVAVGSFSPGFAALQDGNRVLFVGLSGLLLWLAVEVGVLVRSELTQDRSATTGASATGARLESLALVGLVGMAAMLAAVLVALTNAGGGVMVALLALAAAGAYRTVSTRLR